MKTEYSVSPVIQAIYDLYISPAERKILLDKSTDASGKNIRVQCYIPKEAYAILRMFGAFKSSESVFFSDICCTHIEQRAIELKLMSHVFDHIKAGL